jgi:hypothetical protein
MGLKDAELSVQELSQAKREIMVRKISQGRATEIEKFRVTLQNADAKGLEEICQRFEEGKDDVFKVARKLSSGQRSGEGIDLQLARLSIKFSESRSA